MKKFRNKEKQEAFEDFRSRNLHDLEQFLAIWNRSLKNVRRIFNFGKNKEFSNISEKTKMFTIDEVVYKGSSFNNIFESMPGNDYLKNYKDAEVEIYRKRTEVFMEKHGGINCEHEGKTKTLSAWFREYADGRITKQEMNDIIAEYKEQNPDRIADSDGDELMKNGLYR